MGQEHGQPAVPPHMQPSSLACLLTFAVKMCRLGTASKCLYSIRFKGDGFNYKGYNLKRFCNLEKLLKILSGWLNKWSFIAFLHLCVAAGSLTRTSAVRLIYYTTSCLISPSSHFTGPRFVGLSQYFFMLLVFLHVPIMCHIKIVNPLIPAGVVNKLATLLLLNCVKSL